MTKPREPLPQGRDAGRGLDEPQKTAKKKTTADESAPSEE
jgi:hypothetical protein